MRFTPLEAEIRRAELQDLACFAGIAMKFQEVADLSDAAGMKKGDFQGLDEGTKKIILLTFDHDI